jgi:hypothetical protein
MKDLFRSFDLGYFLDISVKAFINLELIKGNTLSSDNWVVTWKQGPIQTLTWLVPCATSGKQNEVVHVVSSESATKPCTGTSSRKDVRLAVKGFRIMVASLSRPGRVRSVSRVIEVNHDHCVVMLSCFGNLEAGREDGSSYPSVCFLFRIRLVLSAW